MIAEREIQQHVVIGFTALQERLATGYVSIQGAKVFPERMNRLKMHGCIEQPARPDIVNGRITNAMVYDVIYPTQKVFVNRRLYISQVCFKMLIQPGGGFCR